MANGTIFERYDCPNSIGNGPQIYDAESDSYTYAWDLLSPIPSGSTSFSETITIHSEYESHLDAWDLGDYECGDGSVLSMGWSLINDGIADCADASDENFDYEDWPTETIPNPFSSYIEQEGFYIIGEITVASFEVVDAYTESFAVGDIGHIDSDGFLKITDRKKAMFKTSGGKYIAPQVIENAMKQSLLIEQIMVIGENQKFPAALIQINFEAIKTWAKEKQIILIFVIDP